jgi:hypothetical protein
MSPRQKAKFLRMARSASIKRPPTKVEREWLAGIHQRMNRYMDPGTPEYRAIRKMG